MPKVKVYNMLGEQVEEIELNENIFGIEVNQHVVYEVVKNQLANKRHRQSFRRYPTPGWEQ